MAKQVRLSKEARFDRPIHNPFENEDDFQPAFKRRGVLADSQAKLKTEGCRELRRENDDDDHHSTEFITSVEFCPVCQFPFRHLIGQSKEWHTTECLANQRNPKKLRSEFCIHSSLISMK